MLIRPGLASVAVAALVAGLGTACGGSDKPRTLPPVETPSVSASDVGSPSAAGLTAFVRRYYEALNVAGRTGNTRNVDALTIPSCSCRRVHRSIDYYFRSGRLLDARYDIRRMYGASIEGNAGNVLVVYDVPAVTAVDKDGRVITTAPAVNNSTQSVVAVWSKGRWYISNIVKLGS